MDVSDPTAGTSLVISVVLVVSALCEGSFPFHFTVRFCFAYIFVLLH